MDRNLVFPGSIPLDSDVLSIQRNTMVALGFLAQFTLGTSTLVDGLACTPTAPASMQVNVGSGSILSLANVDATAYGSLPADTTDALVKMGINVASTSFTLTAPLISGQSQNYLIEASFLEQDGSPVVLPYYNSANPAQPFSGPNNSGTPQNTARRQTVALQLKAAAPAPTGTQATPTVDAGWVGLYLFSVNFGQNSITSANVLPYPGAPFIGTKLPQFRQRLQGDINLYVAATGNDLNEGTDPNTPFATLQAAWNTLANNYDLNGHNATINIANGTYNAGLIADGAPLGAGNVAIVGNTASPSSVIVNVTSGSSCFLAGAGCVVTIRGVKTVSAGTTNHFTMVGGGVIQFSNIEFGAAGSGSHIACADGSANALGNYTISGGALAHISCATSGSNVAINGVTVTLTGTPAFTLAFVSSGTCATVSALSAVFSGSATGPRYAAIINGVINTNGAGATYLPGSIAGTTSFGGQYV